MLVTYCSKYYYRMALTLGGVFELWGWISNYIIIWTSKLKF